MTNTLYAHQNTVKLHQSIAQQTISILYIFHIVGATVFRVAVVVQAAFLFNAVSELFVASRQLVNVQFVLRKLVNISAHSVA
jgi:hypothetical protein